MVARQIALPTAAVTALAGLLGILQSFAPVILRPTITLGVSALVFVGTLLTFLLNPGVVLGVAYWASGGADVPRTWASFGAWAFVASVVGYAVGGVLGLVLATGFTDYDLASTVGLYYNAAFTALFGGVRAGLAGIAGASIGYFRLH